MQGTDFERLLDIVLREGGTTMSIVEAYFNDSGTHPGSEVVCVAGYLFGKEQAIDFDREWRAVLSNYNLPYFRMSACARRTEPFNKLSLEDCATVEQEMIAITNRWMSHGMAITVQPDVFIRTTAPEKADSPYRFCVRFCLAAAQRYIDQKKIEGDCAYFFESGHGSHAEAEEIMNRLYNNGKVRRAQRYSSHTFVAKSKSTPLQATDLLAWQWYTCLRMKMYGAEAPRPGAEALFEGERHGDYSLLPVTNPPFGSWRTIPAVMLHR
jgi:hypothetical protein